MCMVKITNLLTTPDVHVCAFIMCIYSVRIYVHCKLLQFEVNWG